MWTKCTILVRCNMRIRVTDYVHKHFLWNDSDECLRTPLMKQSTLGQVMNWCCQATSHYLVTQQVITWSNEDPGPRLNIKTVLSTYGDFMLKIRRPLGRLIFNMGIAIPGKTVFLIETAPWSLSPYGVTKLHWVNGELWSHHRFLVH